AAAEVADVAAAPVVDRGPVSKRDRDAIEGQAALGIQRAVDRVDHDHPGAGLVPEPALAQLLRHQAEGDTPGRKPLEVTHRHQLRVAVHHRRVVAALAVTDDGLAIVSGWQAVQRSLDVRGHPLAEPEPVRACHSPSSGFRRKPEYSLGKKYVA